VAAACGSQDEEASRIADAGSELDANGSFTRSMLLGRMPVAQRDKRDSIPFESRSLRVILFSIEAVRAAKGQRRGDLVSR
tara:strand:- start:144841 stop:145080 length:240 start_codon:yes stop_codon:yes gene_type:complete